VHKSFPESSPTPRFERTSKYFPWIQTPWHPLIQISESNSKLSNFEKYSKGLTFIQTPQFSIFLIWILESNLNFYFKKIPNLELKFIWFKYLNQCSNFYFWERPKLWFEFQIFLLNQSHFSKYNCQRLFFSKPPGPTELGPWGPSLTQHRSALWPNSRPSCLRLPPSDKEHRQPPPPSNSGMRRRAAPSRAPPDMPNYAARYFLPFPSYYWCPDASPLVKNWRRTRRPSTSFPWTARLPSPRPIKGRQVDRRRAPHSSPPQFLLVHAPAIASSSSKAPSPLSFIAGPYQPPRRPESPTVRPTTAPSCFPLRRDDIPSTGAA
jgi:hypothetical protein